MNVSILILIILTMINSFSLVSSQAAVFGNLFKHKEDIEVKYYGARSERNSFENQSFPSKILLNLEHKVDSRGYIHQKKQIISSTFFWLNFIYLLRTQSARLFLSWNNLNFSMIGRIKCDGIQDREAELVENY